MTRKDLNQILQQISIETGLASSLEQAKKVNASSYLHLEYAKHYGGYRLVTVAAIGGAHSGAFGENACEPRMKAREMGIKLKGILSGIRCQIEKKR